MKRPYQYYLIVTTSTEVYPTSPFTEFQQPPHTVEAKFCIETKRRLTDGVIQKAIHSMEKEFNGYFDKDLKEKHIELDKQCYKVYILHSKPDSSVLLIHI